MENTFESSLSFEGGRKLNSYLWDVGSCEKGGVVGCVKVRQKLKSGS